MKKKNITLLFSLLLFQWGVFCESKTENSNIDSFLRALQESNVELIDEISGSVTEDFYKTLLQERAAPETDFNYTFNETKDGIVITGYTGENDIVIIPAEIEEYPIVAINQRIFMYGVKGLFIPYSIKKLDNECFSRSIHLEFVFIPGSLKIIPEKSFAFCEELSYVIFGNGIEKIGKESFSQCSSLKK